MQGGTFLASIFQSTPRIVELPLTRQLEQKPPRAPAAPSSIRATPPEKGKEDRPGWECEALGLSTLCLSLPAALGWSRCSQSCPGAGRWAQHTGRVAAALQRDCPTSQVPGLVDRRLGEEHSGRHSAGSGLSGSRKEALAPRGLAHLLFHGLWIAIPLSHFIDGKTLSPERRNLPRRPAPRGRAGSGDLGVLQQGSPEGNFPGNSPFPPFLPLFLVWRLLSSFSHHPSLRIKGTCT